MKRSTLIAIAAAIVLIVLVISFYAGQNLSRPTASPTPKTIVPTTSPTPSSLITASPQSTISPAAGAAPMAVTMIYTNAGFAPTTITVKSGGTVTFKNNSTSVIQADSNPHPEHTDNPELNAGTISPGQSKTVTVTRTGTWRIHNHLNAAHQATVIVE